MEIFWKLLLAHLLADFTFQTDALVKWKRENFYGMLVHSIIFMVVSYIICWDMLTESWSSVGFSMPGWLVIIVISVSHFVIDQKKVGTVERDDSTDNLKFFLLDQLWHIMFVFAFFKPRLFFDAVSYKWWILGSIFVIITHFSSILIFYIEKYFRGVVKLDSEKRYFLMADRLVVGFAFLVNGWWLIFIVIAWILRSVVTKLKGRVDYSWLELSVGYAISIIFGILARIVMSLKV